MNAPNRRQIATARDALALVRLTLDGQLDDATALAVSLIDDPAALPGVLGSMASIVRTALDVEPGTDPAAFLAACEASIAAVETAEP